MLAEIKAQREELALRERELNAQLRELNGAREMLGLLEARLRNGMVDGLDAGNLED